MATTLSIIIPTILRETVFETANRCAQMAIDPRVEVIVSVNPMYLDISAHSKVLDKLSEIKNIRIEIQESSRPTAESSAFHSIKFAKNDWVWFVGDDDFLTEGAVNQALNLIPNAADFWLLNCNLDYDSSFQTKYYEVGPRIDQLSTGLDLFNKFGLISATTTLSCLLIRKKSLDLQFFDELHAIQGIYSHSFFLFCMLHERIVGATDRALIKRSEALPLEIQRGLEKYAESIQVPFGSLFTYGLLDLVKASSAKTGIPIVDILNFRELEIIKTEVTRRKKQYILVRSLGDFILGAGEMFFKGKELFSALVSSMEQFGFTPRESLVLDSPVRVTLER